MSFRQRQQIDCHVGHDGIERGIAGVPENVVRIVVFRPLHGLDPAVMAVAAPDDAGLSPMLPQALRHMLDDGPHLRALRGARRAQDRHDRRAACHVIDVHRCEASYAGFWVTRRSGGVVCRQFDDLDAIFKFDTCDDLRQLICAF